VLSQQKSGPERLREDADQFGPPEGRSQETEERFSSAIVVFDYTMREIPVAVTCKNLQEYTKLDRSADRGPERFEERAGPHRSISKPGDGPSGP